MSPCLPALPRLSNHQWRLDRSWWNKCWLLTRPILRHSSVSLAQACPGLRYLQTVIFHKYLPWWHLLPPTLLFEMHLAGCWPEKFHCLWYVISKEMFPPPGAFAFSAPPCSLTFPPLAFFPTTFNEFESWFKNAKNSKFVRGLRILTSKDTFVQHQNYSELQIIKFVKVFQVNLPLLNMQSSKISKY